MLFALVAAALTAAPAPAQDVTAQCRTCALTGHWMAQAGTEMAPPLPGQSPAPAPAPEQVPTERELRRRIDALNAEIRGINVNWPAAYIVLAYGGYVIAPTSLVFGAMFIVYGLASNAAGIPSEAAVLLFSLGVAGLAIGVLGIAAIVYAWINGNAAVEGNRARRELLIQERIQTEEQLRDLRQRQPPPGYPTVRAPVMITLLRF